MESLEPLTIRSDNHVAALPEQHWHWLHSEYEMAVLDDHHGIYRLIVVVLGLYPFFGPVRGQYWSQTELELCTATSLVRADMCGVVAGSRGATQTGIFLAGRFSRTPWARLVVEHPPGLGVAGHSPQSIAAWSGEMAELRDDLMGRDAVIESRSGSFG